MVAGRPQIYTQEFIEKEADALLEWVQVESNMYLSKFAFDRGYSTKRLEEFPHANVKFSGALDLAKDFLNYKVRERLNSATYNERMALRDITNFDYLLKRSERGDMEFASKLKQKEIAAQAETLDKLAQKAKDGDLSQK